MLQVKWKKVTFLNKQYFLMAGNRDKMSSKILNMIIKTDI